MRKLFITFLCCFILLHSFGQTGRKVSTYLSTQYHSTLYDYTKGNNPWGIGLGFQAFLNNNTKFKPTAELTGDLYLAGDKALRLNPDGSFPENKNYIDAMANLFIGPSFHPNQSIYISVVAGPSFISGQTLFGIKPSVGMFLSETQRWTAKVSYINVFNRTKIVNEDYGSLSVAIGIKLF